MLNAAILRRRRWGGNPLAAYAAGGVSPLFVIDPVFGRYASGGVVSDFSTVATFSRTSAATYFDASGVMQSASSGTARTAHHLYITEAWTRGGLLLEPAATNLITYSQDGSQWTNNLNALATSQDATGLDGTTTGITLADDSGGGTGAVTSYPAAVTVATSTKYVYSIAAKADGLDGVMLLPNAFTSVNNRGRFFDLTNVADVGAYVTDDGLVIGQIEDLGGFCIPSINFTTDVSDTSGDLRPYPADISGANTITVDLDGTSSVILSDAQFELGWMHTSRIVTNGSTASRSADSLTIAAADVPGMFWLLTGYLNYADQGESEQQILFNHEVDANNLMKVTLDTSAANTGTITLTVINGGVSATLSTTSNLTPGINVPLRIAFGATASELALAMDGTAETRVSSPSGIPDLSGADVDVSMWGTLSRLVGYASDMGDAGQEEATSPDFFT